MKIQRYELTEVRAVDQQPSIQMVEDANGQFVKYEDVQDILSVLGEFKIQSVEKLTLALLVAEDEGYL